MALLQAADIVELAMQLEQNGESFYRAVAAKSAPPKVKALFEHLAGEEVKHRAIFAGLGRAVRERPLLTDEEWERYLEYLNATVQSALFQGADKALAAAERAANEQEAARMAMAFEKETLLFFYDLRDRVPAADRAVIDKVVAEEKTHIARLAEILRPAGSE